MGQCQHGRWYLFYLCLHNCVCVLLRSLSGWSLAERVRRLLPWEAVEYVQAEMILGFMRQEGETQNEDDGLKFTQRHSRDWKGTVRQISGKMKRPSQGQKGKRIFPMIQDIVELAGSNPARTEGTWDICIQNIKMQFYPSQLF